MKHTLFIAIITWLVTGSNALAYECNQDSVPSESTTMTEKEYASQAPAYSSQHAIPEQVLRKNRLRHQPAQPDIYRLETWAKVCLISSVGTLSLATLLTVLLFLTSAPAALYLLFIGGLLFTLIASIVVFIRTFSVNDKSVRRRIRRRVIWAAALLLAIPIGLLLLAAILAV